MRFSLALFPRKLRWSSKPHAGHKGNVLFTSVEVGPASTTAGPILAFFFFFGRGGIDVICFSFRCEQETTHSRFSFSLSFPSIDMIHTHERSLSLLSLSLSLSLSLRPL